MADTALWRSLLAATAGFVGYGAWAAFVNRAYGTDAALLAAVVQGSYSFAVTLCMTLMMEKLYAASGQAMLTSGAASIAVVGLSWTVNTLAGTPEVIMTILPGAVISSVYSMVYVAGLQRLKQGRSEAR